MSLKISKKEKDLLIKFYKKGISIESLVFATGIDINIIKKILGVKK